MTPIEKLDSVIVTELENLGKTPCGTDAYDSIQRSVRMLLEQKARLIELENDLTVKRETAAIELRIKQLEMESKEREHEANLKASIENAIAERELKKLEIEANERAGIKDNRRKAVEAGIGVGLSLATAAAHEWLTNSRMNMGYQFEKTGIVTSPTLKNLVSNTTKKW